MSWAAAVCLAPLLFTAPPWLPWRSVDTKFSSSFPPFGQPYGPVSALPQQGSPTGEDRVREKRRRRSRARAAAGIGPGTLDPYKTEPGEDNLRRKPLPGEATRTQTAQEEAQWPGRLHPPWWWEKPPEWTKDLPWWLSNKPIQASVEAAPKSQSPERKGQAGG